MSGRGRACNCWGRLSLRAQNSYFDQFHSTDTMRWRFALISCITERRATTNKPWINLLCTFPQVPRRIWHEELPLKCIWTDILTFPMEPHKRREKMKISKPSQTWIGSLQQRTKEAATNYCFPHLFWGGLSKCLVRHRQVRIPVNLQTALTPRQTNGSALWLPRCEVNPSIRMLVTNVLLQESCWMADMLGSYV